MKRLASPIAVVLLNAIGAVEASVSAQQLAEAVGRPRLELTGVTLTAAGLLASAVIYLMLGNLAADDRTARRRPRDYAAVPDWFITLALGVFVAFSCAASVVGGGALAWTGRRLSRAARSRPPA